MNSNFQLLQAFDFSNSTPYLWVFKDSARAIRFRTSYVQTDNDLNHELVSFANDEILRITEHSPYSHIAQTNENSCLTISSANTDFSLLKNQIDRLEADHRITNASELKGIKGYVVKFIHNGVTVYGIKRSTSTFKTSYPRKMVNMIFSNGELTGVPDNSFSIKRNFDFYVINDAIFIADKLGFESVIQHRTEYVQAFLQLQQSPIFCSLFTDINPVVDYVGNNSMQLRRMAVIEEKAVYTNPNFISILQRVNNARGWGINFDTATSKIIPCEDTVSTLLQVLLDHRLMSEITNHIYDVPETRIV
ncbi:DUF4868 domain-containing protein [Psychrobacter sp.]|uniref:DUF4868 domain-containing protein n=1 Tax=Psychrobacter sp. TaxID=56811 RepID=UPI003F9C08C1